MQFLSILAGVIWSLGSQSVVLILATFLMCLLEMLNLRPQPRPAESKAAPEQDLQVI